MWMDRQAGDLLSAWGAYVPEYVTELLRRHPAGIPIGGAEPTEAIVIFADISGFTPMSEALARAGHQGTEELTGILNAWFDAMVRRITRSGGSVAEFAGDALTAVFACTPPTQETAGQRAVQCALDMQADMVDFRQAVTRAGSFRLTMKVGIAAGALLQSVMGDPAIRLGYVLNGPALVRAAAAERHARGDEVVVDETLALRNVDAVRQERYGRWSRVDALRERLPPPPAAHAPFDEGMANRLAPFLHPSIAERLRSGQRELVNEHRKVTAVFVGLPEVCIDDRRSVTALQDHLAAAIRLIAEYDGHFRHVTIGERGNVLVTFFGAPVSHEDDEERAVRCALDLLDLPGGPFRAGVGTGAVYCGDVGGSHRREYAVIGDSVNLAARLTQAAADGQLLIDRATYDRVRDGVVLDRLERIAVKGKSDPIEVWSVRATREPRAESSTARISTGPLIGRDAEMATIRDLLEHTRCGAGHVVSLTGGAGIGKSRLAAEITRGAEQQGFAVLGGASRSHGTTTSYLVWRSIVRGLLDLNVSLPAGALHAQIVDRIAPHTTEAERWASLLAPVLNVSLPGGEAVQRLDAQIRDGLLRSLLRACLRDRARSTPLLLVLDDCHWIDPASAALLKFLAQSISDRPVLILVVTRGTIADAPALAGLSRLPHHRDIHLDELPRTDAERLVRLRLHEHFPQATDQAVIERIAERGEGNPFYLGELVNYLHHIGAQPRDPRGLAALELPDGLQRLLMARIDQLSEAEKATIKVASVLGRRFRADWISRAYPAVGEPKDVARHLERLHDLDLTPRRDAAGVEYQFKHAMTQDAAYQSMTFGLRESLHERVGLLIESTEPERLGQYVDLLAHHFGHTSRTDKQRVWFRAAGDAAKAAFANEAAMSYYSRLLPLLPQVDTGDVLIELGGVWHLTGRWSEAEQAYRQAMTAATEAGRPDVVAAGQRELGDLFMYNRSYAEAVPWLRRAAQEFERLGDETGLLKALDRITFALYQQGAYVEALGTAERHRTLASEAGDLAGVSIALTHMGLIHLETGHPDLARTHLREALDTAMRSGDRRCLLHAANNLALDHSRHREHRKALTHGWQAFDVAQEIGFRQTAGVIIGNMGEVYADEGDHDRARRCIAYSLRIALELRDWTSVADQLANAATVCATEGDEATALRLFEQAIALARHLDAPFFVCGWLHRVACIHVEHGRFAMAEPLNCEALAIADVHGERDIQIRALVLGRRIEVAQGASSAEDALATLRLLEKSCRDPQERALVLAALWRIDPTADAVRIRAAALYSDLYARTPSVEFRDALALLTGATPPLGPRLPPLPGQVADEQPDIAQLLREVDQLVPQLVGSAGDREPDHAELVTDSGSAQWIGLSKLA